jgi:polyphosphate glucokinase
MDILGIDVGGSGIKGALVNTADGRLVTDRIRYKTPQPSTPISVIKVIGKLVREFDYTGPMGVGFPAVVMDGIVRSAANVDDKWIGYSGASQLTKATGCPVTMVNDADAAGIAEMHFGAGRSRNGIVLILTLGTGIGSALFINGRLVPNSELGHLYLRGRKIDAEDFTSDRIRTSENLSWKKWARRLNEYLNHLEMLFSPNLFILGGGVSKNHSKFIPLLEINTEIVAAQLRNEAGIVGAAMAVEAS